MPNYYITLPHNLFLLLFSLFMFGDFLVDMIHTLPPLVQWFIDCNITGVI